MGAAEKWNGDFKHCSMCGRHWRDLPEFVTDAQLRVEGYQACFVKPELGLVMVTHRLDGCGTTLGVPAAHCRALYDGPEFTTRRTGLKDCEGHCLRIDEIDECDADCDMAWVRTALQCLRVHKLPPHMRADDDSG